MFKEHGLRFFKGVQQFKNNLTDFLSEAYDVLFKNKDRGLIHLEYFSQDQQLVK